MAYKNRALIFEIISEFGFNEKHIDEVIKLAESENGKYIQSPSSAVRIIKFNHWFIVSNEQFPDVNTIVIEETTKNVQYSIFNIQFSIFPSAKFRFAQQAPLVSSFG